MYLILYFGVIGTAWANITDFKIRMHSNILNFGVIMACANITDIKIRMYSNVYEIK